MNPVRQLPLASPLVRWHLRHVVVIWVGVRVIVMMTLAGVPFGRTISAPPIPFTTMLTGASATFVSVILTVALATLDRRRIGAPLLFANMGYSAWWLTITTGAILVVSELVLRVSVRIAASGW